MSEILDTIIIGAGPAGLSAAIGAARTGLSFKIFEGSEPGGQTIHANLIENFPGFPEGVTGREFIDRLIKQTHSYGIHIINKHVLSLDHADDLFTIQTEDETYRSKTVIVACGLKPKRLNVAGEDELFDKYIFAYSNLPNVDVSGKKIIVVGSGDAAFDISLNLSIRGAAVTILMRGDKPKCLPLLRQRASNAKIETIGSCKINSLAEARDHVTVVTENKTFEVDYIITCIGKESCGTFINQSLIENKTKGLFWAGDCCGEKQRHIAIAVGEAITAVMAVTEQLQ